MKTSSTVQQKPKRTLILAIVAGAFISVNVWATVAIYRDSTVQPYIWGSGAAAKSAKARDKAFADCMANGGTNCTIYDSNQGAPGWAAVAHDSAFGTTVATYGKQTKKEAKHVAKHLCKLSGGQNCKIVTTVYDRNGK